MLKPALLRQTCTVAAKTASRKTVITKKGARGRRSRSPLSVISVMAVKPPVKASIAPGFGDDAASVARLIYRKPSVASTGIKCEEKRPPKFAPDAACAVPPIAIRENHGSSMWRASSNGALPQSRWSFCHLLRFLNPPHRQRARGICSGICRPAEALEFVQLPQIIAGLLLLSHRVRHSNYNGLLEQTDASHRPASLHQRQGQKKQT